MQGAVNEPHPISSIRGVPGYPKHAWWVGRGGVCVGGARALVGAARARSGVARPRPALFAYSAVTAASQGSQASLA